MPKIDLKEIALRESEQVEWKENVANVDDVLATICAFANDWSNLGGGYVVCGARELKDEAGFPRVDLVGLEAHRLREIEGRTLEKCRERVDPGLIPLVEYVPGDTEGRRILVFVVPASRHAHMFRAGADAGRYYVRMGRSTVEARNGILRELLVRKGMALPWDHRPCDTAAPEDIDLLTLREVLTRARLWDPGRDLDDYFDDTKPLHALMPSLGSREPLTNARRPRNFAVLMFARDLNRFVSGAYAVVSVYPGTDRGEPYAERQELIGPLASQASRALDLVNAQAGTVFDKTDLALPNVAKYPERALKEAIVNAFVHRDYEINQPVRITVFSDRIEITSPGSLLAGVDREAFVEGRGRPLWRNQALSLLFNRLNLAQAEGQGVPTILRSMREAGNPSALFELGEDSVTCVLPAHPRHALARTLKSIEEAVVLGHLSEARRELELLVQNDPFNVRTVDLFLNVCRLQGDSASIENFVELHLQHLEQFPRTSIVLLAEALLSGDGQTRRQRDFAAKLLAYASQSVGEESDTRRTAVALRKAGEIEGVVALIDRQLQLHPGWQDAGLLQIRGRALIDLAKKSMQTANSEAITPTLRRNAWDQTRRYLERAERDLMEAQRHSKNVEEKEWLDRDVAFLETMKERAKRPGRRRRRGRGGRGTPEGGQGPTSPPRS